MSNRGRKPKYSQMIATLKENVIYSPASIASFVKLYGKDRLRVRTALSRMACNNRQLFPKEGDGEVFLSGHPKSLGWFGWRWKKAYRVEDLVKEKSTYE